MRAVKRFGRDTSALSPQRILYACRTLGVPDHDRCNGLAAPERRVLCLVWPRNRDYIWDAPNAVSSVRPPAHASSGRRGWSSVSTV